VVFEGRAFLGKEEARHGCPWQISIPSMRIGAQDLDCGDVERYQSQLAELGLNDLKYYGIFSSSPCIPFKKVISTMEKSEVVFREVQQFRQIWLWLIILPPAALFWYGCFQQFVLGAPFGTNPAPDVVLLLIWLLCGIALPALFFWIKMITEVRSDGLYVRFFPFRFSVSWSELRKYEVRTYNPILDYGGWGVRYGFGGMAYNVSGNSGVQLELTNGKRVLIGSQQPDELVKAIDTVWTIKSTI
jgi:hypothetical protein